MRDATWISHSYKKPPDTCTGFTRVFSVDAAAQVITIKPTNGGFSILSVSSVK